MGELKISLSFPHPLPLCLPHKSLIFHKGKKGKECNFHTCFLNKKLLSCSGTPHPEQPAQTRARTSSSREANWGCILKAAGVTRQPQPAWLCMLLLAKKLLLKQKTMPDGEPQARDVTAVQRDRVCRLQGGPTPRAKVIPCSLRPEQARAHRGFPGLAKRPEDTAGDLLLPRQGRLITFFKKNHKLVRNAFQSFPSTSSLGPHFSELPW